MPDWRRERTDLLLQPYGDGEGASDISSLDGRLGCSYDHSGVGGALPAPARAQTSRFTGENMDQVRRDTINIRPIPYLQAREMLKDLARCLTNRSNPWHNGTPKGHKSMARGNLSRWTSQGRGKTVDKRKC